MIKNSFHYATFFSIIVFCCIQCSTTKRRNNTANNETPSAQSNITSDTSMGRTASDVKSLQGNWQFEYFTMVNTNKAILFPMQLPSLNFDLKSKKFSGTAGCNNISGRFVQDGNNLTFTQPYIMTRMSCNAMGEKIFVDYLNSIKRYNINENTLELIGDAKPVIIMKRVVK